MDIYKLQISLRGRTEVVSTILSQNGHGSHSQITNLSHIILLITLTPNLSSIMVLDTSVPLIITMVVEFYSFITIGPSLAFVKWIWTADYSFLITATTDSVNLGTNFNRPTNDSVIWQSGNACHVESLANNPSSVNGFGLANCSVTSCSNLTNRLTWFVVL